jgi:hypothetical protein
MARVITFDPVVITGERPAATEAYAPVTNYPVTAPDAPDQTPGATASGGAADMLDYPVLAEPATPAADERPPADVPVDVDLYRVTPADQDQGDLTPPPPPPEVTGEQQPPNGYADILDDRDVLPVGRAPSAPALTQALPLDGQTSDGWYLQHRLRPADQQLLDRQPAAAPYANLLAGAAGPLLASADASFAPAAADADAGGAPAERPGPAPPAHPPADVSVTPDTDAAGNVTAAEVQLKNPDRCYVPWSNQKPCGIAAGEGLARYTRLPLYRRPGRQASLRTYDRQNRNTRSSGAVDAAQTDIRWNADKTAQALGYIKRTIDAGLPVYIGVNERGRVTNKRNPQTGQEDPALGPANDGVTDHFLLITGYRTEVQDGRWRITALSAVDNAALGQVGRFPRFVVGDDGRVIKPEIPGHENDNRRAAITMEYQLAQVWVYAKDEPSVRNQSAWWPY